MYSGLCPHIANRCMVRKIMRARTTCTLGMLIIIASVLTACNIPTDRGAALELPGPTLTPTLRSAETLESGEAEEAGETEEPEETEAAEGPCYDVSFVSETVEDGTEIVAGTAFDKTWRLVSDGCLPLPEGSQLVFDHGDSMGGPASVLVPSVPVGQEFDVTVPLVAPGTPGEYTGYWHIVGPGGDFVGQVYVQIEVVAAPEEETEEPEPTEEEEEEGEVGPGEEARGILADSNLTFRMSLGPVSAGGCANGFQASREANGDFTRGFASFDISDLHGAEILSAALNLTDYNTRGDPFDELGPLTIEQIEFGGRCGDAAYDSLALSPLTITADSSIFDAPVDITGVLAAYLASGSPDYFQIRAGWPEGTGGSGDVHGIQWGQIALEVDYIP